MADEPHITYFNMGPWPIYVGFTTDPDAFAAELKRLKVDQDVAFVGGKFKHACTHYLTCEQTTTCIITIGQFRGRSKEQVAALIAHEAVHVAQELWESIGEEKPGREAEAYLVQQIVQCCLSEIWNTGLVRKSEPFT